MNTILSTCFVATCLVLCSLAADLPKINDMEFLNGLPMPAVEEFVTTQLDRNFTRGERENRLKAWAKKQGKKVQKQFSDFMKKMKKEDRSFLQQSSRAINKVFSKELLDTFFSSKLSHSGVCKELNALAEKMVDRVRAIGNKGPRSHTPCNAVQDP